MAIEATAASSFYLQELIEVGPTVRLQLESCEAGCEVGSHFSERVLGLCRLKQSTFAIIFVGYQVNNQQLQESVHITSQ